MIAVSLMMVAIVVFSGELVPKLHVTDGVRPFAARKPAPYTVSVLTHPTAVPFGTTRSYSITFSFVFGNII